jgi:thiamine kinase-like enzyme
MVTLFKYNILKKVGISFSKKENKIKKFFIYKKNIYPQKPNNEYKGYSWYNSKLKKKKINITKNKLNLILTIIKGRQYNFWSDNIELEKVINIVLKHYYLVWGINKKFVACHGDLTLSNIIFLKKNEIRLIDWEHFRSKEDWGFDLAYFLLSLIILPNLHHRRKKIFMSQYNLIYLFWKKIFLNKNLPFKTDPINYFQKKYKNDKNNFFNKINKKLKKEINIFLNN